jgi:hypothetical protein
MSGESEKKIREVFEEAKVCRLLLILFLTNMLLI